MNRAGGCVYIETELWGASELHLDRSFRTGTILSRVILFTL
jgi:hypothetical protein